jgi:hypothetical protein
VSVNTATIADSEFKDVNDSPIGRVAFFATVTPNKLVKARGVISSGTVAWDQIELED